MLKILLLLISSFTAIPMFIHLSKIEKKETRSILNYSNQYLELIPKELLNKDSTTVELNLSNNNIKTIPKELAGYQVLEVLNLKGNKQLEIDESFKDLAKIKTLKEVDLSECELAYLPFTINEISNLEVLNLSNNHLFEIPDMMHKMHELRIVDLSGNDIKELGYAPSLWTKLEVVNLKNNPKLNVEHAFKSLSYLKKLERVEVNNLEVLPESTSLLKAKEIVFEECSFKKTAIDFTGNSRLTSIVFDNCKETKFEKVLPVIATNKQLTELTLANSGLEELSIDSIQFPKLERLDISGNDINERDLIELEKQFPNCIIETGIASKSHNIPETREIKAPFKNVIVEPEVFSIKPDQEQVLTTTNSKIIIPKNAFLDKDGKLITTPVSIKYKEILNPVDQILSGIPMEYDSAGVTYNFESAGMIDFRAESNGKEVFPNPDALINVELKSEYTDTDYGLYSMDDETGKWDYAKPAEQKRVQPDSTSNTIQSSQISPNNNRFNYPIFRGRVKPTIGYNQLKFNFDNKSKYRLLIGQRNNSYTHTLKNTSLNFIKKTRLIIEDKDWKKYKKGYKNFYKNNNYAHKIDSTDLLNNICFGYDFIVNKEKDIFEITINYIDTSLTLPCRLKKRGNPLSEQKANLKFWQKLQNEKIKESKSNEKVIKSYSNAMTSYEEELKEFQKELRAYMEENEERFKAEDKVSYILQLNAFNIWNCDRFKRNVRGQKIKATFKNIGNKVFVPIAIYIINKTKNGYEKKLNADSFTYEKSCKHSLLLLDKDGKMGVVNEASFSKAINKIGVKKSFETELIAEDEIDRDQLLAKLI